MPSWCDNIGKGSQVLFKPEGILKVHPIDTTKNTNCYDYSCSIYVGQNIELSLREYDMIIEYEIVKINDT